MPTAQVFNLSPAILKVEEELKEEEFIELCFQEMLEEEEEWEWFIPSRDLHSQPNTQLQGQFSLPGLSVEVVMYEDAVVRRGMFHITIRSGTISSSH